MRIKIDGEIYEVKEVYNGSHYYLPEIETYEGPSFVLARDSTHAGKKAREYWEDMAQNGRSTGSESWSRS